MTGPNLDRRAGPRHRSQRRNRRRARPAPGARRPRGARLRARPRADRRSRRRRGRPRRRDHRRRAARGAGRRRRRLLPHPLDGDTIRPRWTAPAASPTAIAPPPRTSPPPRAPPAFGASSTSAARCPPTRRRSPHLASRLEVEETLLAAAPEAVALRASIVISPRSRSFRFLVRLVERVPVMPLPAWRVHRTRPIDGRDVITYLRASGHQRRGRRPAVARHRRPRHRDLRRARRTHPRRAPARAPARRPARDADRGR